MRILRLFLFPLFPFLIMSGCSGLSSNFNTATGEQETTLYSTDREQQLGASVAFEVEKEFKQVDDPAMNARVDGIVQRIAAVCDRQDLVYVAKVIEEKDLRGEQPMVNAFALPGGYVYVLKGLMDYIKTDDQLAAVIAHEVGHITARHSIKRLQASYGSIVAIIAAMQANGALAGGLNATLQTMLLEYSQEDELQADQLGIKYMRAAGFHPTEMAAMLERLQEYDRKQPIRQKSYGRTHPYVHQRIAAANRMVQGDLSYRDWVRLTGEREDYKK